MRDLPSGIVTFLFTDIEGSTRLLHEHGEGYVDLLAEHRRELRAIFTRRDGVEVDTQGDAFFVAFARAEDAVAAAEEIQGIDGPVRVQVVLSEPTRDTLGRDPGCDLGLHRLKDLGAPERLFQLGMETFPPLRSLNATNLPAQTGALVGRADELVEIAALIGDARVVTLTGAGGSGK